MSGQLSDGAADNLIEKVQKLKAERVCLRADYARLAYLVEKYGILAAVGLQNEADRIAKRVLEGTAVTSGNEKVLALLEELEAMRPYSATRPYHDCAKKLRQALGLPEKSEV